MSEEQSQYGQQQQQQQPQQLPGVVNNFILADDGLYYIGDDGPTRLCGRLEVIGMSHDTAGERWTKKLKWQDPQGRIHIFNMPLAMLASGKNAVLTRLLDGGLDLPIDSTGRNLVLQYINETKAEVE